MEWRLNRKLLAVAAPLGLATIYIVFRFSGLITGTSSKVLITVSDQSGLTSESKLSVEEALVAYRGQGREGKTEAATAGQQPAVLTLPWMTPVTNSPLRPGHFPSTSIPALEPRQGTSISHVMPGHTPTPARTNGPSLSSSEKLSLEERVVLERFQERRQHLQEQCEADPNSDADTSGHSRPSTRWSAGNVLVDEEHHILFHQISKNGCTFWQRVFSILAGSNKGKTVWDISGLSIHQTEQFTKLDTLKKSPAEQEELYNQSTKILFVRDPYERLFSGYVDKLFSPCFMGRLKQDILNKLGRKLTDEDGCPAQVSFETFLLYVVNSNEYEVDTHFTRQHTRCLPCRFDYDYIGHLETLSEDSHFLLRHAFHVDPSAVFGPDQFDQSSDMNIMEDVALRSWKNCPQNSRCQTSYNTLNRLWTLFQVRGFLSVQRQFPLSREDANRISLEEFMGLVRRTYQNSGDRALVKGQKQRAVAEAFRSASLPVLTRVESYVLRDCRLFNYSCSLEDRFFQLHSASPPPPPPTPVFRMQQVLTER